MNLTGAAQGAAAGSTAGPWGAALGAGIGLLGGGGGGGVPMTNDSYGSPVNVSVGGLNVPAFPNFPISMQGVAGQTITPAITGNNQAVIFVAVAGVVALLLLKK